MNRSPKKSARKSVTKGKAKLKDPPSPRASQSKKKKSSPREKSGGSVETSSAAYSKKGKASTSAEVNKVAEGTTEYDDDYEVYDDEEFDESGEKKIRKGSVQGAFSRKRGFTKKRKKERRAARED